MDIVCVCVCVKMTWWKLTASLQREGGDFFKKLGKLIGCVSAPAVKQGWRSQKKSNYSWLSWIETSKAVHRRLWGEVELGCLISSVYQKRERERTEWAGEKKTPCSSPLLFWMTHLGNTARHKNATSAETNNTFNSPRSLCWNAYLDRLVEKDL